MEDASNYLEQSEFLKALAHPTRLCIVNGLIEREYCNVNTMKDCLSLPQSTVSQQLAILKAKGIIEGRRNGTEVLYRVVDKRAKEIVMYLSGEKDILSHK